MAIFEKGLSYNFMVERIAEAKGNYYYVIVIDNKELYHCGASLKDLGKKCFAISKIEDIEYIEKISCVEEVKTQ